MRHRWILIAALAVWAIASPAAHAFNGGCTSQKCDQWNDTGPWQNMYQNYWANLQSALSGLFR